MIDVDPFLQEMKVACWTEIEEFIRAVESSIPELCEPVPESVEAISARCLDLESHAQSIGSSEMSEVFREFSRFASGLSRHPLPERERLKLQAHLLCLVETFRVALTSLRQGGVANSGEIIGLLSSWRPDEEPGAGGQAKETGPRTHLICRRGETSVAIPVHEVLEILEGQKTVPLPLPNAKVKGLVNLRGEALPVLRLEPDTAGRFTLVSQAGSYRFGIEVDEVCQVLDIDTASLQEAAGARLATIEDRPVMVLELSKAVTR